MLCFYREGECHRSPWLYNFFSYPKSMPRTCTPPFAFIVIDLASTSRATKNTFSDNS
nr:MAG TPA: hypothetical protein [Caudoviricetes sp.]